MLARKVDPSFRLDDLFVQQSLLARIEEREGAASEFIVVPHPGGSHLEFLDHPGVYLRHIAQRLDNAIIWLERAPALRILGPSVAGKDNSAAGFSSVIRAIQTTDRQAGQGPSATCGSAAQLSDLTKQGRESRIRRIVGSF